ncbi:MAG TPA: DNA topoisomerase (ATP-hydrolyzing) subunit B [bacterium]|nr:DNA topoisomerase (ATP-hydrolyzing) subunit B [bacterium]HPP29723.1 DNA topoisomerase (ATP-hydrolyzing) subunit B [bacterium]
MEREQQRYDATTIQLLGGIEAVRKRPAMYIGDTSISGLHHLVYEVIDNSIDEAMAGFCNEITVTVHTDNSVSVADNGRGIPVDMHKTEKRPALEVVMTVLHAGGKFDKKAYRVSGGLHGVGVSVVNALSEWLEVEVKRDGKVYHQRYERGKPVTEVAVVGKTKSTGTKVTFKPDEEIFETIEFDDSILSGRIRELAFLNAGVKITFEDERKKIKEEYCFEGGLVSFVEHLNRNKKALSPKPLYFKKSTDEGEVEIAFQYNDGYSETVLSFANNVNTKEGGTHLTGFRAGLTRAINEYGRNNGFLGDTLLAGEDIREGLTAVVSVKVAEPQFEGQTKTKLGNSKIRFLVEGITTEQVLTYLEENPEVAREIINKCVMTAKAREAARKARELTRKKLAETGALPGKLADCTIKEPEKRELFIVEGDSAGGSAKQGRDRFFQAILPLKGKIINAEKAPLEKVFSNEEIRMMIGAIGGGVGEDFDASKARYRKIIIMTDADIDGAHIRTLLLTFFYRQMTDLIKQGYVYIAQPPLYKVKKGRKEFYVDTEAEMDKILIQMAKESVKITVTQKDGKKEGKQIDVSENMQKIGTLSKRMEEISKSLESKGINLEEIFNYWKSRKRVPIYIVRYQDKEEFFATDKELSNFMEKQNKNHIDLFSGEERDYKMVEIYEARDIEKILRWLEENGINIEDPSDCIFTVEETDTGKKETSSFTELYEVLKNKGKKGLSIQRYKGLGEMNPQQLWETTMDPKTRRMKLVTIEDAVKAEEVFTILMGDAVEPRRDFIERFAKEVKNLDI